MLIREAEALFWLGRTSERMIWRARLLDLREGAQWQQLVREPLPEEDSAEWDRLREQFRQLALDRRNPNSVLGCALMARRHAMEARAALSACTWSTVHEIVSELLRLQETPASFLIHTRFARARLDLAFEEEAEQAGLLDALALGRRAEWAAYAARCVVQCADHPEMLASLAPEPFLGGGTDGPALRRDFLGESRLPWSLAGSLLAIRAAMVMARRPLPDDLDPLATLASTGAVPLEGLEDRVEATLARVLRSLGGPVAVAV